MDNIPLNTDTIYHLIFFLLFGRRIILYHSHDSSLCIVIRCHSEFT